MEEDLNAILQWILREESVIEFYFKFKNLRVSLPKNEN